MKIYIKCSSGNIEYVYHGTKTESAAMSIIANGFNTFHEVCFSSSRNQAEGYGPYIIKARIFDVVDKLNIYDINEYYSFDLDDYPPNCDGLREPVHNENGAYIYYIYNVNKLNRLKVWEYDGERMGNVKCNSNVPSVLYHFTHVDKFLSILHDNSFKLGHWNNLSMTTNPLLQHSLQSVRLSLNTGALQSDGYMISKYTFKDGESQDHNDFVESEDEWRIVSTHTIPNFLKYIIDVRINSEFKSTSNRLAYMSWEHLGVNFEDFIAECNNHNIPVYYMDDPV